jgi:tetratricopeptide (TPR) repeat protein/tRNA A-37 threonylcarbamoyl transferase component Bud32
MATQCPNCKTDNPGESVFCAKCGTQIKETEEKPLPTQTIEAPREELTTGSTFAGRYQIIEEIGKGGMGKVYKVQDTKIKETVALKLIKPEIASDKKTIERFGNEMKFSRKVSHRNVCRMYDLGEEKGSHFITMEYVPGEDLRSSIRRFGQLPIGKSISITKQICEGLAEAHRLGVIHRDLKSNNIMIDKEGNVRIMDFGIARSLKGKGITEAGVMIGTPEYISPEQVEGKEVDQRADIYSLGVVLYEMVTGRVPFEGETALSVAHKHKYETPPEPEEFNPHINEDLNKMILKCLEKDKENRYQRAEELFSELENIEKGIPSTERVVPGRKPLTSREITVTFGLRKLYIPALVFIGIVIIGVVIWQLLPEKEAVIAPKIENSIAVISFENLTGDPQYDSLIKIVPSLFITKFETMGFSYVATLERLQDIIKQIGKDPEKPIDTDTGFKVARREGIAALVVGKIAKAGNVFVTDIKVLDVETKKSLTSATSQGEGEGSIISSQIDELSRQIFERVGTGRQKIESQEMAVADVTTNSLEAYKYFLSGVENSRKFYYEDARKDLENAVDIDPTFATAYLYLAATYSTLGNSEARDRAINYAKSFSEKATDKERLFIESGFAQYIERDVGKAGNILRKITEKYPREKIAHFNLGIFFRSAGFYKRAIEEQHKVLELDPAFGNSHNDLGYAYIGLEDYEKAIEHFKEYIFLNPEEPNPYDSIADANFRMGRLDEAISYYKEAISIEPKFFTSHLKLGYIYALKEEPIESMKWIDKEISVSSSEGVKSSVHLFRGLYNHWLGSTEQAFIDLQRADALAEEIGSGRGRAAVRCIRGVIYRDMGELELARKNNESWRDEYEKSQPVNARAYKARHDFLSALIDLKEGKLDSTKSRFARMKKLIPSLRDSWNERTTFLSDILEAEILLAEGNPEQAIATLEEKSLSRVKPPALQYVESVTYYNIPGLKDVLARAYQQKGDLDSAIVEYERLVTFDPNSKARYLVHPLYHYRLAKLYEEKGLESKAIEHLEKFLDLWKDADPGTAEVDDARERLAGLKGERNNHE